jgi:hypothetical protein
VVGYTARVLEVPLAAYLRDAWARPLLAAAVPLLVWSLGGWVVGGWPAFAGAILAGLVPYGVVVLGLEGRRFRFGVAARIPVPRR